MRVLLQSVHSSFPRRRVSRAIFRTLAAGPRLRTGDDKRSNAFDDAHVAVGAIAEHAQRFLVARAVMRGLGRGDAVELDDHGALQKAGLVGLRRDATCEETA